MYNKRKIDSYFKTALGSRASQVWVHVWVTNVVVIVAMIVTITVKVLKLFTLISKWSWNSSEDFVKVWDKRTVLYALIP